MHHHDWPSGVSVWINDVRIGTWTSPAAYGGRRGVLTPAWCDTRNTRYGGLNLFGRGFGNYPQDIVLPMRHQVASDG